MKPTAREAAELLGMLGDTPSEIKANLQGAGFKGRRMDSKSCPCGVCLKEHFGIDGMRVGSEEIRFWNESTFKLQAAPLPEQVKQFVKNMDMGRYPSITEI